MDDQTKAPGLDIFKFIITLGLIAALVYFYLQNQQVTAAGLAAPTAVSAALPTAPSKAVEVLPTLVEALPTVAPTLAEVLPTVAEVLPTVAPTIVEVLPTVAEVLPTVAPTLVEVLPTIAPTVVEVLPTVAPTLTEALATAIPKAEEALPTPAVEISWPPYPESGEELTLDEQAKQLLTPQGTPVYALDASTGVWVPVVPADLQAQLPEGAAVSQAEAGWVIVSADGATLYTWDPVNLVWVPVVPADLQAQLPEGAAVSQAEAGWVIASADGVTLYTWDPADLVWVPVEQPAAQPTPAPQPTPTPSPVVVVCDGALPTRLQVGDTVEVLMNLNFRSSPGIGENWIRTHTIGTRLKVIGGPQCIPYAGGAYLWWTLEHPDGMIGWSAEAPINAINYYLAPVK